MGGGGGGGAKGYGQTKLNVATVTNEQLYW